MKRARMRWHTVRPARATTRCRFELNLYGAPITLEGDAPGGEWTIRSREDAMLFARPITCRSKATLKSIYSRDGNLWHLRMKAACWKTPWQEPEESMFQISCAPENAPE